MLPVIVMTCAALGLLEGDADDMRLFVNAEESGWWGAEARGEYSRWFPGPDANLEDALRPVVVAIEGRTANSATVVYVGSGHYAITRRMYLMSDFDGLEPYVAWGLGLWTTKLEEATAEGDETAGGVGFVIEGGVRYNVRSWAFVSAGGDVSYIYTNIAETLESGFVPAVAAHVGLGLRL